MPVSESWAAGRSVAVPSARGRRRPGPWPLGFRAAGAGVFALLFSACSPAANDAPERTDDLAGEVGETLDRYLTAVSERDAAALRELYAEAARFIWIEDGAVRYRSAADVLEGLAAFPPDTPMVTELTELSVVGLGESGAHAWCRFTTTVGEGPGAFSFGGVMSLVLERRGGAWRIVGGHTSSPRADR